MEECPLLVETVTNSELAARLRKCLIAVESRTGKGAKLQDSLSLLRAHLADSIPEAKAARKALVGAVDCGVADILRNGGGSNSLERGRCVGLLVDEQCLSEEWAQRVVAIWVEALGGKSCDPVGSGANGAGGSDSFQVRKCASCGAEADADDVYCAGCGAELVPVSSSANGTGSSHSRPGGPANTGVNSATPSAQTIAVLATFAPRDALRGLFASFPHLVRDWGRFSDVAERLFAQDVKRCTRYVAVQKSGVMSRLVGQSRINAGDWERIIGDLAEVCGFSHEVCVECASEWAYALNVTYPEEPVVATPASALATAPSPVVAPPGPATTPPSSVVSPVGQVSGSAGSARHDRGSSSGRGRVPSAAGDRLSLTLPGNIAMEFVWCPPGTFTMGSRPGGFLGFGGERGRYGDETQHEVTLSHGFWMARYPTTQRQYKALIGSNPSKFKGDARPVEKVSWNDAVAFCEKVNARLGSALPEGFRCGLPTEAQWEYACRAGTTSALNSGRELTSERGSCPNLDAVAWYKENSGNETHAVGQKRANAWGLYDMHGNVWEWCRDWFADYSTGSVTDPTGPESGSSRASRGGSWLSLAGICRSANRGNNGPSDRNVILGFRPALAF